MSPIELVRAKEEEIKLNRFESAFAVDETGNVLMDKAGEQFHVGFTLGERERMRAGLGVIFTHNHPRGWDYPPESFVHAAFPDRLESELLGGNLGAVVREACDHRQV